MYSKIQGRDLAFGKGFTLSSPSSVITIISPGSISLINLAPIISKAQVSDANIFAPSNSPKTRGLIPKGSLAPINFLFVSTTSAQAPDICIKASTKRLSVLSASDLATSCNMVSVSEVERKIEPFLMSSSLRDKALVILPL